MRIEQLSGQRVAIWGCGREGRAAWLAVRSRLPSLPLTVLCSAAERETCAATMATCTQFDTAPVTLELLRKFDVVIKSPGISPYRSPIPEALAAGVQFVSGSQLWFAENRDAKVICVTGTKGKSTTAALIAHLLRGLNVRTALAGNIGLPLLELLDVDTPPDWWVIELSSFQTRDAEARPRIAVITNLIEEHLDWHGSVDRYLADKLALLADPAQPLAVLNAVDPALRTFVAGNAQDLALTGRVHWFNDRSGWHCADGAIRFGARSDTAIAIADLPVPGLHNASNVCAALTAVAAAGFDAFAAADHLHRFRALPHRLQALGSRDGIDYVDDSIATTPQAAIAALDHYAEREVVMLIGGHDRGLDWQPFADRVAAQPPRAVVCTGATRTRVLALLQRTLLGQQKLASRPGLFEAEWFEQAFLIAQAQLPAGGVLLLSPGAPSFGQFHDYAERGRRFAELAGFDPNEISDIAGLGIA